MKEILLSADNSWKLYSVPEEVADNLEYYCSKFEEWLRESKDAKKYRVYFDNGEIGVCYTESDFIKYLNNLNFLKICYSILNVAFL